MAGWENDKGFEASDLPMQKNNIYMRKPDLLPNDSHFYFVNFIILLFMP